MAKKKTTITNEYICDDRPIEMPEEIANMTDEEVEIEYARSLSAVEFDYTIYPDNSPQVFKNTCENISAAFPNNQKKKLLIDVDGSTIQIFLVNGEEIIVYDDYYVGAVYVKSKIDLTDILI